MSLEIIDIVKKYDGFRALDHVGLVAEKGEFIALLGPSGSGKTTLLRILAGLAFPDSGEVMFEGESLLAKSARERRVGLVFQHYALFRHMTVAANVAFGLKVRARRDRPSRHEIHERVNNLLGLVQLEGLGNRYPNQLSGGQRQRVALARALAIEPRLLLLDEPFGALDAKVRKELRRWLRELHDRTGVTTVFVTHDQDEALDLADRVAVMNKGHIEQFGAPKDVYDEPATAFVTEFLGGANRFDGTIDGDHIKLGDHVWPAPGLHGYRGEGVAYVRPHEFIAVDASAPGFSATVVNVLAAGPHLRLDCIMQNGRGIEVALPGETPAPSRGETVRVAPTRLRVFPAGA